MSASRYRLVFWLALSIITLLALLPLAKPVVPLFTDKAKHILAFWVLATLALRAWPMLQLFPVLASFLMLYGLLIEGAQYFIPYRTCSGWDLVADAVGVALCGAFSSLWALLLRHSDPG